MKTLIHLIVGIGTAIFGAFIFQTMWGWFIAPKFGLPYLSVAQAGGVMLCASFPMVGLVIHIYLAGVNVKTTLEKEVLAIVKTLVIATIVYPLVLGAAYVWHLFGGTQ